MHMMGVTPPGLFQNSPRRNMCQPSHLLSTILASHPDSEQGMKLSLLVFTASPSSFLPFPTLTAIRSVRKNPVLPHPLN